MNEKKKSHKPLPRQYTLTICQSDLDMLESAISQLASRELESASLRCSVSWSVRYEC